jgi:hypothetical protein
MEKRKASRTGAWQSGELPTLDPMHQRCGPDLMPLLFFKLSLSPRLILLQSKMPRQTRSSASSNGLPEEKPMAGPPRKRAKAQPSSKRDKAADPDAAPAPAPPAPDAALPEKEDPGPQVRNFKAGACIFSQEQVAIQPSEDLVEGMHVLPCLVTVCP